MQLSVYKSLFIVVTDIKTTQEININDTTNIQGFYTICTLQIIIFYKLMFSDGKDSGCEIELLISLLMVIQNLTSTYKPVNIEERFKF